MNFDFKKSNAMFITLLFLKWLIKKVMVNRIHIKSEKKIDQKSNVKDIIFNKKSKVMDIIFDQKSNVMNMNFNKKKYFVFK